MDVEYKNAFLRKVCTDAAYAEKKFGTPMAEKIQQRIDEIQSASTIEDLIQYRIGRCHALTNNRKGQYAMDLVQAMRLVFTKKGNEIQIAYITEIVDYH